MQVTITDDGQLQLVVDGVVSQPISVEAAAALSNAIPAAQAVLMQVPLAEALRNVAAGLSSGTASAVITVQGSMATVVADPATFDALAQALGVTPGVTTTSITSGPITVNKTGA